MSTNEVSNEHYEFLQLDQLEEKSLRQFNAELLHRIGEFRKRNLELGENENASKVQLAAALKSAQETERRLTMKFESEAAGLRRELEGVRASHQESNDEWSRRLSRLSDDGWARDLENETLRRTIDELQLKLSQSEDEHQSAYQALRKEYADIDRCYGESNAALLKERSDSRQRERQHEVELQELTEYLNSKSVEAAKSINEENERFRELLSARDARLETERSSLEAWKVQLTALDQQLKVFSDKLKRGKLEMTRLSQMLESEVRFAVANPFTDYLMMAESEVETVSGQLAATSNLSPAKAKLEIRLQQAVSHRDGIRAVLEKSGEQMNAHVKTIQNILKSIEYFV